jgi:predicted regulator of Ras-like GTPase activity (Roadblock/LC7/MglB family)
MMLRLALLVALVPGVARADKTFAKGTGETWDCSKDAVVAIKTSKGTYGFFGECKRITISGAKNAVSISQLGKLAVSGSDNMIDVDQVDTITVSGARNKITWKKAGTGDKPKITAGSKTNHVTKAK